MSNFHLLQLGTDRPLQNNVGDEEDVGDKVGRDDEDVGDKVGRDQSWHKWPSAPRALRLSAPFFAFFSGTV